jgi:hypothetical protein
VATSSTDDSSGTQAGPSGRLAAASSAPPGPTVGDGFHMIGWYWTLDVNGGNPILPDQPIQVTWCVDSWTSGFGDPGEFSLQVSLLLPSGVSVLIYDGSASPVRPTFPAADFFDTGEQVTNISPPTEPAVSAELYGVGVHNLYVTLQASNYHPTSPDPFLTRLMKLQVIPDPRIGAWWDWTVPGNLSGSESWGTTYEVCGTLTNKGSGMSSDAVQLNSLLLKQTDDAGNIASWNATLPSGPLVLGASTSDCWPIKQSWSWEDPLTYYPSGPRSRQFTYVAEFSFSYVSSGTPYPATDSVVPLVIVVGVPDMKWLEAEFAFSAQAEAVTLAAAAFVCAILGGPACAYIFGTAAGLEGAADRAHNAAQDPPEPDFRYLQVAHHRPAEAPGPAPDGGRLPETSAVVALFDRILSTLDDLWQSYARLLGARIDQSEEGIHLQRGALDSAASDLDRYLPALPAATVAAVKEQAADPAFTQPRLDTLIATWHRQGIPTEVGKHWTDAGLPSGLLGQLERAIREPDVAQATHLEIALPRAASALFQAARGARQEALAIIGRGEQ